MSKTPIEKNLTLPEVKEVLESLGEENLDQLQRRTLDYVTKFSKVPLKAALEIVEKLVVDFDLSKDEAIQIVNCMPEKIASLRIFLSSGQKIIETSKLDAIIKLLDKNRKKD